MFPVHALVPRWRRSPNGGTLLRYRRGAVGEYPDSSLRAVWDALFAAQSAIVATTAAGPMHGTWPFHPLPVQCRHSFR